MRFLPRDIDEYTHRANLQIADVVLDTYPYNGATTTLEVLWQGIPLVTLVGEQFSARNSYTFMINAGIEAGIGWNEVEYIHWGVKLGLDRSFRQDISHQLLGNRDTSDSGGSGGDANFLVRTDCQQPRGTGWLRQQGCGRVRNRPVGYRHG